jgi:cytochrome P450
MAFTPPYPCPHKTKSSFVLRFVRGWHSWLHILFERSYRMKMGKARFVGGTLYMVNEPKYVRQMLQEEPKKYPKHKMLTFLLEPLLGSSIFTTNGEVWERQRRLVDQGFQQARMQLVFPLMKNAVNDMLTRLDQVADGRSYEVDGEMTYITADVMFRTILSESLAESDAKEVYEAFLVFQHHFQRTLMLMMYRIPSYFSRRAGAKAAKRIRAPLEAIILRRYQQVEAGNAPPSQDILGAIMEAVDPVKGDKFSYQEMVDQICMLFLAGHETSASALAWAIYLVSNSPEIQERMRREIEQEVGGREFEYGDARKLRTTFNVFRETLRLYPPVGFFIRQAMETHCMRDKTIEKDSPMMISPWLIQRHRDLWERPDEFDPDRFETTEGKESAKCAYIPFSAGPRVCIGQAFAIQEAVLVLASVVRRYQIDPVPEHVPQTAGRVTVRSDNGIRVRFRRRTAAA